MVCAGTERQEGSEPGETRFEDKPKVHLESNTELLVSLNATLDYRVI